MKTPASSRGTLAAGLWVAASAGATLAGWGLSAAGCLNRAGYLTVAGVLFAAFVFAALRGLLPMIGCAWWQRAVRRLRRPLPQAWLAVWLLAALGGALHAPNNIDALTYRLPRVLHWLAAESWHWIETNDVRMNYSATGMEWQMAPLLAMTGSDRLLFLLNAVPALLLPGLIFSFLRQAGVAGRVAWRWMWLLPLGHVFILQAGGIGNDANGAIYFLAACHFGMRAARVGDPRWLGLSLLSAGLMTGLKASNLPLLLPYAVATWPAFPLSRRRPGMTAGFALAALLLSALPTLALNQWHSRHWSGDPANTSVMRLTSPLAGVPGNVAQGLVQNLTPPVFPWADAWNQWSARQLEPAVRGLMGGDFPRFSLRAGELPQEEWAGLGLLLILLLLAGCGPIHGVPPGNRAGALLGWTGWAAALVFCLGLGSEMTARLLAPYYPVLVLPLLRRPAQNGWCATRSWRALAALTFALTALVLVVSPARPLLPLGRWAERWQSSTGSSMARRAATVYTVYAQRADPLAGLRQALPESVRVVGFLATADDSEISLWRPYGHRRVVRLTPGQPPGGGFEWVVARADAIWPTVAAETAWLEAWNGSVVRRQSLQLKASRVPEQWALVRLNPAGSGAAR